MVIYCQKCPLPSDYKSPNGKSLNKDDHKKYGDHQILLKSKHEKQIIQKIQKQQKNLIRFLINDVDLIKTAQLLQQNILQNKNENNIQRIQQMFHNFFNVKFTQIQLQFNERINIMKANTNKLIRQKFQQLKQNVNRGEILNKTTYFIENMRGKQQILNNSICQIIMNQSNKIDILTKQQNKQFNTIKKMLISQQQQFCQNLNKITKLNYNKVSCQQLSNLLKFSTDQITNNRNIITNNFNNEINFDEVSLLINLSMLQKKNNQFENEQQNIIQQYFQELKIKFQEDKNNVLKEFIQYGINDQKQNQMFKQEFMKALKNNQQKNQIFIQTLKKQQKKQNQLVYQQQVYLNKNQLNNSSKQSNYLLSFCQQQSDDQIQQNDILKLNQIIPQKQTSYDKGRNQCKNKNQIKFLKVVKIQKIESNQVEQKKQQQNQSKIQFTLNSQNQLKNQSLKSQQNKIQQISEDRQDQNSYFSVHIKKMKEIYGPYKQFDKEQVQKYKQSKNNKNKQIITQNQSPYIQIQDYSCLVQQQFQKQLGHKQIPYQQSNMYTDSNTQEFTQYKSQQEYSCSKAKFQKSNQISIDQISVIDRLQDIQSNNQTDFNDYNQLRQYISQQEKQIFENFDLRQQFQLQQRFKKNKIIKQEQPPNNFNERLLMKKRHQQINVLYERQQQIEVVNDKQQQLNQSIIKFVMEQSLKQSNLNVPTNNILSSLNNHPLSSPIQASSSLIRRPILNRQISSDFFSNSILQDSIYQPRKQVPLRQVPQMRQVIRSNPYENQQLMLKRGTISIRELINNKSQYLQIDDKLQFSIFVKVISLVQLMLQPRTRVSDQPKMKLIVADQTGAAVVYMNYQPDIRKNMTIRISECQLYLNGNSYQISKRGFKQRNSFFQQKYLREVNTRLFLSNIQSTTQNKLFYPVSNSHSAGLSQIARSFYQRSQNIQMFKKKIIITICQILQSGRQAIVGDYSGKSILSFNANNSRNFINGETFIIFKPLFKRHSLMDCLQIYMNKDTRVTRADQKHMFRHTISQIPNKILNQNNFNY